MDKKLLDNDKHFLRYIKSTHISDDETGPPRLSNPDAFKLKEEEKHLSGIFYEALEIKEDCDCFEKAKSFLKGRINVSNNGGFSFHNVGAIHALSNNKILYKVFQLKEKKKKEYDAYAGILPSSTTLWEANKILKTCSKVFMNNKK